MPFRAWDAFLLLGLLNLVAACSSVQLASRTTPGVGPYQRTAVLYTAASSPDGRRTAEGALRDALYDHQSQPGRSIDVVDGLPSPEEILERLKAAGFDSMLVVHRQSVVRVQGETAGWRSAFESSSGPLAISNVQGNPEERVKPVTLPANEPQYLPVGRRYVKGAAWLVDLSRGDSVWSAEGTLNLDAYAGARRSAQAAAKGIVKKLAADGLLLRPR